jgi:hypothetical protein
VVLVGFVGGDVSLAGEFLLERADLVDGLLRGLLQCVSQLPTQRGEARQ